jgi:hypothetical protein
MMSVSGYATKRDLKAAIGQRLRYVETSMFGPGYRSNGINPVVGPSPQQRKWYASVHVKDDVIVKVE